MKTLFEKFEAYNAYCFEEAIMPLRDQGVVMIRGENLDEGGSNGAGKSALFELLAHTLFGKTSKGPVKNLLLNKKNPKDFHTRAFFRRRPGSRYRVDQYRKHSKKGTCIELRADGNKENIAPTKYNDAQAKVAETVGLLWNQFQGQVYLSQKYTHAMLEGTPKERQEYMSRYFGLESLDTLISEVTTRMNSISLPDVSHLEEMLAHVQSEVDSLGDLDEAQELLEKLRGDQSSIQQKLLDFRVRLDRQERAREVDEDLRRWQKFLAKVPLDLDSEQIKETLVVYRSRVSSLRRSLSDLEKAERLREELASFDIDTSQSYEDLSKEVEDLSDLVIDLERKIPKAEMRAELLAELDDLGDPSKDEDLAERLEAKKTKLAKVKDRRAVLRNEISNLEEIEDVCPTCSRPLDEHDKRQMLSDRKSDLEKLKPRLEKLQEGVQALREHLDHQQTHQTLQKRLEGLPDVDLDEVKTRLEEAEKRRQVLTKTVAQLRKVAGLQQKLSELDVPSDGVEVLESRLDKAERRLARLEDAYEFVVAHGDVEYDPEEHQRISASLRYYEKKLEEVNEEVLSVQDKLGKGQAFAKQREELLKSLNSSSPVKNRHQALHYINFTLKDLKKQGLRESSELLTQVLPVYLSHFYPQGTVHLRVTDKADGFDLIFEKGGQSISLPEISGGQAKRVGIAIIFAFAKMGKRTTNLLIADEPFTHLDPRGREACYELLSDLDIGTILVTAHDRDLQETRKYDQIWTVRMKNHRSRLYTDG